MHPGLTIPPPGTPEFSAFDRRIVLRIRENDVAALIVDCGRSTAGAWTIREICH